MVAQTDDGDGDGYVHGAVRPDRSTEVDFGHVAWVTAVHADGTVQIEDYNGSGTGVWGTRRVKASRYRYIGIGTTSSLSGSGTDTPGVVRNGMWFVTNTLGGPVAATFAFGNVGDIPVAGDWDG